MRNENFKKERSVISYGNSYEETQDKFRRIINYGNNSSSKKIKHICSYNIYPSFTENELLLKVKNGNISGGRKALKKMLEYVLSSSEADWELVKIRLIELCTLMSRASIDGGSDYKKTYHLNNRFIKEILLSVNPSEISDIIFRALDKYTENIFSLNKSKNSAILKKIITYMNENYKMPFTLDMLANYVHLNPSYISTMFKKETGTNFVSYLNRIRIEQSILLLRNSDMSILDIAMEVGFEDQSYFTKVFKKITGKTPKQVKTDYVKEAV